MTRKSFAYSKSIYVSFKLNKLTPLHLWPLLDGTHERKREKQRNVFNQQEKLTLLNKSFKLYLSFIEETQEFL